MTQHDLNELVRGEEVLSSDSCLQTRSCTKHRVKQQRFTTTSIE